MKDSTTSFFLTNFLKNVVINRLKLLQILKANAFMMWLYGMAFVFVHNKPLFKMNR